MSFNFTVKKHNDILNEMINQITYGLELVTREPVTYQTGVSIYPMTNNVNDDKSVTPITLQGLTVTGTYNGNFTTFIQATDYDLIDNSGDGYYDSIEFGIGGDDPEDNSTFYVTYHHQRTPCGLVAIGPGTVVRSMIAAITRQIEDTHINTQIGIGKIAIDYAEGSDLDNLIAMYGFTRNPSTNATGYITCNRTSSAATVVLASDSTFSKPVSAFGREIIYRSYEPVTWWAGRNTLTVPIESVQVGSDCNAVDREINIIVSAANVTTCSNDSTYTSQSRGIYNFRGGNAYVYSANVTGTVDFTGIDSTTGLATTEAAVVIANVLPGTITVTNFSSITNIVANPVANWAGDNTIYIKDNSNPWVAPVTDMEDPTDGDGFYTAFAASHDGDDYLTIPSEETFSGDGDNNYLLTLTHYPIGDMIVRFYDDTGGDYESVIVPIDGSSDISFDSESRNMTFINYVPSFGVDNISVTYDWRNIITDGTDRESDSDLRSKIKSSFSNPQVSNAARYETIVSRVNGVESVVVYDGNSVGWTIVPKGVVYILVTPDTSPISDNLLFDVNTAVTSINPVGIDTIVLEPDIVYIYVRLQIDINSNYIGQSVKTSVIASLVNYINSLAAGEDVKHSELNQAAENTLGVDNVIIHEIRYDSITHTEAVWEGGAGNQAYIAGDAFAAFGDWDVPIGLDLTPGTSGLPTSVEVANSDVIQIGD